MFQIKSFEGNGNNDNEVNAWLRVNPNVKVKDIKHEIVHDWYQHMPQPTICNQWVITTVIYELPAKKVSTHA